MGWRKDLRTPGHLSWATPFPGMLPGDGEWMICGGKKPPFTMVPSSGWEQSKKGWWCLWSCHCHLFVTRSELEFVPKSQSRHPLKVLRRALGEDMWKKEEDLPPIRQHTKAGLPEVPLPADSSSVTNKQEEVHNKAAMNKRTKRQARQLPGIPGAVSGKTLLVSGQSKGKPAAKGQAAKPNQTQAARLQRHKQRQGEKIYPVGSKFNTETNSSMSPEAWMPKEITYKVMTPLPIRDEAAQLVQSRPERFWSVLKDPQYTVLAGSPMLPAP
ncbi:uncharacterized protein LOC119148420 isoform X2 [Falco rusticolus]|uniref:uncharacterized protein LOC119148420 isoform X2 n=1 Tax=Falco rusticolus TaxID=120794 RepID=UPI0018865341|nr:uncharacterized protein LOC119148420 isoform X2 [Falco rusticolus]